MRIVYSPTRDSLLLPLKNPYYSDKPVGSNFQWTHRRAARIR
jgi:hypothetical protein